PSGGGGPGPGWAATRRHHRTAAHRYRVGTPPARGERPPRVLRGRPAHRHWGRLADGHTSWNSFPEWFGAPGMRDIPVVELQITVCSWSGQGRRRHANVMPK